MRVRFWRWVWRLAFTVSQHSEGKLIHHYRRRRQEDSDEMYSV